MHGGNTNIERLALPTYKPSADVGEEPNATDIAKDMDVYRIDRNDG